MFLKTIVILRVSTTIIFKIKLAIKIQLTMRSLVAEPVLLKKFNIKPLYYAQTKISMPTIL